MFIEGGGRTSENVLEDALPGPEDVVIEVLAEDLSVVDAATADDVDADPVVPL